MSNAPVWPDGARGAVGHAHDQWMKRSQFDPTSVADDILTALDPFVQQRINAAVQTLVDECRALRDRQSWIADAVKLAPYSGCYDAEALLPAVRRVVADRDHALTLAEARRLGEEGAREMLNEERAERSQAEQILADADADRQRLRDEVARLKEQLEYYTGPRQESHPENVIHRLRAEVARLQAEVARVTADRDAACRAFDLCERALRRAEDPDEVTDDAADTTRLDWVLERLVTRDGKGGLLIHRYPGGVTSLLTLAGARDADGWQLWDTLVDRAPTARAALDQARAAERPPYGDPEVVVQRLRTDLVPPQAEGATPPSLAELLVRAMLAVVDGVYAAHVTPHPDATAWVRAMATQPALVDLATRLEASA